VDSGAVAAAEIPETEADTATRRGFVAGFLGSFFLVLAAVLAFNVVVDPFDLAGSGVVPTAVEPDRSIKLDLLQHLKRSPQILILGDSRGRQAEPSYLRRLTGHTGFNAAVMGGTGYHPDGGLATKAWPPSPEHVAKVKAEAAAIVANIRQKPPHAPNFASKRFRLFEHLLAYLNGRGERLVIVFNPLYPTVYAVLERYDSSYLTGALDYLCSL
jgi:hypothetical protein